MRIPSKVSYSVASLTDTALLSRRSLNDLSSKVLDMASKLKPPAGTRLGRPVQPTGTTSFSVGDRVLVDGSKPGVIAFFGTTEFARGVWPGVVLDVPEGKNNGRVAGVQYFECEPLHRLFTRLFTVF